MPQKHYSKTGHSFQKSESYNMDLIGNEDVYWHMMEVISLQCLPHTVINLNLSILGTC